MSLKKMIQWLAWLAAACVTGVAWLCCEKAAAQAFPPPPVLITSSTVPPDVEIPDGFDDNPIVFFDDYSWRSFIALVWPALQGKQGQPDTSRSVGDPGPRVFETYKALHEVFHPDGSAPSAWNEFDPTNYNPVGIKASWGVLTLGSFSKFSNLGQAVAGGLTGPLISQNTNYVRFLIGFNQTGFEQIAGARWFLRSNLTSVTFPFGSLDIKSSWMIMKDVRHPERYYTTTAWMMDPFTGKVFQGVVGLVGLHIVQKTKSRPQWIWSTFEQVDNVPPAQGETDGPFGLGTSNFNDGTSTPMPNVNPYTPLQKVLSMPTPRPFNVTRINPIDSRTQDTNRKYRAALKGTVWQFYQLVMTQWPLPPPPLPVQGPVPASQDGTPENTFPGSGSTNAFANTTMETFDQKTVFKGCMSCHNPTLDPSTMKMSPGDFVWALSDHAFPPVPGTPDILMHNPSFKKLRAIMSQ